METDRNLLFGVLALQADFLTQPRFVEACAEWADQKDQPLADLLVERGWLSADDCALVARLVERKLEKHGGDMRATLAEGAGEPIRESLRALADTEIHQSLAGLTPPTPGHVLISTTGYTPDSRNRYTLSRLHATGGLGRVWLARDTSLDRDVALKEVRPERGGQHAVWTRFLKEAKITGQLEHPGIVPVYDLNQQGDGGRAFYTMRFVKGRTLQEAVAAYHHKRQRGELGPLDLRELLSAMVGVSNAVAYAHSKSVIHRDLKPANVVLGDFGEVIVLDWGLAKQQAQEVEPNSERSTAESDDSSLPPDDATLAGQVLGTPAYMAPEQAGGLLDQINARTDVYGLGAILYEVLSGRPPFTGNDTETVLRQVRDQPPQRPREQVSGTPPALEAVCLKALAKRPQDRYPSATAFAADIQHWLADEPVSAYREPLPMRARRWARRHRALVIGAAALLVSAVLALAIGLAAVERERRLTAIERDQKHEALTAETKARAAESQARTLAMTALRKLTDGVVEQQLSRRTRLTDDDRRFLREILRQYEEFAALPGEDAEQRVIRAEGHSRVAAMRATLGEIAEAEASYRQALALYAPLAAELPDRIELRQGLAAIHNNLGMLLKYTGRAKEAEAAFDAGLAVLNQLVADFPARVDFRHELATRHNNRAILFSETGRPKESEAAYREALAIHERLAAEFPAASEYRRELAKCHNNLANLLNHTGRPREAETAYAAALAIHKLLAAEFPAVPEHRQELATSLNNQGNLLGDLGRITDAEADYLGALAIQRQLAADFPTRPEFRQELGGSHNNLALLLKQTGRPNEAEAAHRQAVAIQKQLTADFPTRFEFRHELAVSHENLGILLREMGRLDEAQAASADALAVYEQLAADFPATTDFRNDVAGILFHLARLAIGRRDFDEARRRLEQAEPHIQALLAADRSQPDYHESRLLNLMAWTQTNAGQGDQTAAVESAARLRDVQAGPPGTAAYYAACALALCVPIAEKGNQTDHEARAKQIQLYADQAMAALQAAVAKGWRDPAQIKEDPELDPLRDREDFKALVADLEAKAKAKGQP